MKNPLPRNSLNVERVKSPIATILPTMIAQERFSKTLRISWVKIRIEAENVRMKIMIKTMNRESICIRNGSLLYPWLSWRELFTDSRIKGAVKPVKKETSKIWIRALEIPENANSGIKPITMLIQPPIKLVLRLLKNLILRSFCSIMIVRLADIVGISKVYVFQGHGL